MRKVSYLFLSLALIAAGSGCALVFKGDRGRMSIQSDPANAEVYINGQYYGNTPLRLELQNSHDYVIEFHKPGYRPVVRNIDSHVGGGWIVLDVLCGLVPVVIDAATGAWYDLDQHWVSVILERQQPRPGPVN